MGELTSSRDWSPTSERCQAQKEEGNKKALHGSWLARELRSSWYLSRCHCPRNADSYLWINYITSVMEHTMPLIIYIPPPRWLQEMNARRNYEPTRFRPLHDIGGARSCDHVQLFYSSNRSLTSSGANVALQAID